MDDRCMRSYYLAMDSKDRYKIVMQKEKSFSDFLTEYVAFNKSDSGTIFLFYPKWHRLKAFGKYAYGSWNSFEDLDLDLVYGNFIVESGEVISTNGNNDLCLTLYNKALDSTDNSSHLV